MRLSGVNAIITDSRASKEDILRHMRFSDSDVHIVPLAPSHEYAPVTDNNVLRGVREKYHLPEHFILYVGDINWNKNIPGLIRGYALARIRAEKKHFKKFPQLVLAGNAFSHTQLPEMKNIQSAIISGAVETHVRMIGFIQQEDLPALYTLAACYVQVSFAEGFGLPVLEAMACGCRTVVSGVSSLSEIAGPSMTVQPGSDESIAEGLLHMVQSTDTTLWKKCIEWSKRFSWKKTASETVKVYENLVK